jgi:hypothetical protein
MTWPQVLIYKRTHTGDPDPYGTFGYGDCMGRIRGYAYDAVIGIGVSTPWPGDEGIADRITWVGVGPQQVGIHPTRGAPLIRFKRWSVFDAKGKDLKDFAPRLAEYFYARHRRYFFSDGLREDIQRDIARILRLAKPRSRPMGNLDPRCPSDCPPGCPPRKQRKRGSVC